MKKKQAFVNLFLQELLLRFQAGQNAFLSAVTVLF